MTISIVIPTYNEAGNIGKLISYLNEASNESVLDIIVADGGSNDDTIAEAKAAGAIAIITPDKGRSAQMNYGANLAKGELLYFVHADTFPPRSFVKDIKEAVRAGYDLGRYRTKFDSGKLILKANAWATRFDLFVCMGGDQTLFIKRSLFEQCNGFNESMQIMEDYDFCSRARYKGNYKILNGVALVSARKYETNTWLQVQAANFKIASMYRKGVSQKDMMDTYKKMLRYRDSAF
jgi:rSAM/selenodomain-associated transferase 2